ncbi:MAG TPA: hypothetical protein VHH73_19445 [Verrucomicrobiae bacterium]|nr:hypothetical protein [Verrucomicrobiae bacterium]
MKAILSFACLWLAVLSLTGQGNPPPTNRDAGQLLDGMVLDRDGKPLTDTNFVAQLFAGPSSTQLWPVGTPEQIRPGARPGYLNFGPAHGRQWPKVQPGAPAFWQIRVWDRRLGTIQTAAVAARAKHGESEVAEINTAGPAPRAAGPKTFKLSAGAVFITFPPGYSMFSNPLHNPAGNAVALVLTNMPEGTTLSQWNSDTQKYLTNKFAAGAWTDPHADCSPGRGGILGNPLKEPITVIFTGDAGPPVKLMTRPVGFYMMGSGTDVPVAFTNCLGFPLSDGDMIYRLVDGKYKINNYDFGEWQGGFPILQPGEAVLFRR